MTDWRERLAGIDDWIEAERSRWGVPGLAVAVLAEGEVLHQGGYGLADLETGAPVTNDTLFAIGSCTKAFTAMALGLLVDDGKLDWDAPVRRHLPGFALHDVAAGEGMTARDLLCHRSGLPRHDLMWYGSPLPRWALFERLRHLPPSQPFRYGFQYQNPMYMAAGCLVETISGMSWEAFVRERIFEPLGMTTSVFSVTDAAQAADAARPHRIERETRTARRIPFRNIDAIGPAGSIHASANEMLSWLWMQMNEGRHAGRAFVSAATLKAMHQPHVTIPPQPPMDFPEIQLSSYGLGWAQQSYRGHVRVRHTGGIDGFISDVSFLPAQKLGVMVFNNGGDALSHALSLGIYDRLLGAEPVDWRGRIDQAEAQVRAAAADMTAKTRATRQPDSPPAHPLSAYAGMYAHPGYGALRVTEEGEGLQIGYNGLNFALTPFHYEVFEAQSRDDLDTPPTLVAFSSGLDGRVNELRVQLEPAIPPIAFARQAGDEHPPAQPVEERTLSHA